LYCIGKPKFVFFQVNTISDEKISLPQILRCAASYGSDGIEPGVGSSAFGEGSRQTGAYATQDPNAQTNSHTSADANAQADTKTQANEDAQALKSRWLAVQAPCTSPALRLWL